METMRPFVICHIISSIDGRISGKGFEAEAMAEIHEANFSLRRTFNCDGILNGTVTAAEIYSDGYLEEPLTGGGRREDDIYVAPHEEENYAICVDPRGRLRWSSNLVDRAVMPRSHVIEVITESAPPAYESYLRDRDISYIRAGKEELDLRLMMERLGEYGIRRLLVTGGGTIDHCLLAAGLIDEISVVIAPIVVGEKDRSSSFDESEYSAGLACADLRLLSVREMAGGSVHLRYGL